MDFPPVISRHIAVFLIDFPDTPAEIKAAEFPTKSDIEDTLADRVARYLNTMSYGAFTVSGDVFGYFTHQDPVHPLGPTHGNGCLHHHGLNSPLKYLCRVFAPAGPTTSMVTHDPLPCPALLRGGRRLAAQARLLFLYGPHWAGIPPATDDFSLYPSSHSYSHRQQVGRNSLVYSLAPTTLGIIFHVSAFEFSFVDCDKSKMKM